MDTQTTSVESPAPWWQRLLARRQFRSAVFLASYLAACAVATALVNDPDMKRLGAVTTYLYMLALLPVGFVVVLVQCGLRGEWLVPLPWLTYLGVSIPAVVTKKRWVFVALYIIFIILLVLSVRGCASVESIEIPGRLGLGTSPPGGVEF